MLDIVHQAVALLATVNDDPAHLFGHKGMTSNSLVLCGPVNRSLNDFRDHLNELFSTWDAPCVPLHTAALAPDCDTPAHDEPEGEAGEEEPMPCRLSTRQVRRPLAWHIAHQLVGIVAGARQDQDGTGWDVVQQCRHKYGMPSDKTHLIPPFDACR
ncbi:hypothetical protein [Streptomyces umbrinus]|uniref:hypothetical protein n=1 Tax=Streptomyces umbrinus TaxID=67370 RepID=UPI0027D8C51F|nr:hypothetical protein [Streptomyces umbrinus]